MNLRTKRLILSYTFLTPLCEVPPRSAHTHMFLANDINLNRKHYLLTLTTVFLIKVTYQNTIVCYSTLSEPDAKRIPACTVSHPYTAHYYASELI